jgi:hypothetical protein
VVFGCTFPSYGLFFYSVEISCVIEFPTFPKKAKNPADEKPYPEQERNRHFLVKNQMITKTRKLHPIAQLSEFLQSSHCCHIYTWEKKSVPTLCSRGFRCNGVRD